MKITQMMSEDDELTPYQLKQAEYYRSPEGLAKLDAQQKKYANIQALTQQILASSNTSKWTGEGKGSVQKNAADMAQMMVSAGITDIRQFGKVALYAPVQEINKTFNGQNVSLGYDAKTGTQTYGTYSGAVQTDGDGNSYNAFVPVPEDAKLTSVYGIVRDDGGDYGVYLEPVDTSKLKTVDGKLSADTGGTTFGNKLTGQAIANNYETGGDAFGGTYDGKGNTGYRVQLTPDGTPIFYTQGASSNDLVNIIGNDPILSAVANIAAGYFGGPAGVAALQAAMGKDIKDIAKSTAMAYLGGQAGNYVSGSSELTNILGKAGTDALSNVAKQYVSSGGKADIEQLLLGAGLNYGVDTFGDQFGMSSLTDSQRKMLNTALSGAAGKQSLEQILMNVAMTGVMNQKKSPADEMTVKGEPDNLNDFLASIDQYKVDQNADASGQGYYDEITGKFINDEYGGLLNPLGSETGNFDPDKEWEYKLVRPGVWADADGNELDMSYLPNSEETLTGEEIMRRAGALPGDGTTKIKVPTPKGSTPSTTSTTSPDSSLAAMIAAMNGGQQTIQVPSQDPFAHIKLMKDLFGTNVDLTPTDSSDNAPSQKSNRSEQDDETTSEDAE